MSIFNHRVGDAHSGENTMKTIYWRKSRNRTPTHYQGFACHNIRIAPFGKKSKSAKDTARHDKQQLAHTHSKSKSSNNSNFNSNSRLREYSRIRVQVLLYVFVECTYVQVGTDVTRMGVKHCRKIREASKKFRPCHGVFGLDDSAVRRTKRGV